MIRGRPSKRRLRCDLKIKAVFEAVCINLLFFYMKYFSFLFKDAYPQDIFADKSGAVRESGDM